MQGDKSVLRVQRPIGPRRPKTPGKPRPMREKKKKKKEKRDSFKLLNITFLLKTLVQPASHPDPPTTKMSIRPSLFMRWISRSSEVLQRSPIRAAHLPSAQTPTMQAGQPLLSNQVAMKATRRSLSTTTSYSSRPTVRTRPGLRPIQLPKQRRNRRYNSGSSSNNPSQAPKEGGSLSQRLRKLSREYGWAAVGVYFGLSALDFPFCFAAVRLLGVDRIGHFEHVAVQTVKDALHSVWPQKETTSRDQGESEAADKRGSLAQAEVRNQEEASMSFQSPHAPIRPYLTPSI